MDTRDECGESPNDVATEPTNSNRRAFLKASVLVSSRLLMGSVGAGAVSSCGCKSDWKGLSFPKVAFHNFLLFDGIANHLQKNRILLVNKGRIEAIERGGDLSGLGQYRTIDLKGRTLMPGLIDNHVHITVPFMFSVNFNVLTQMNDQIVMNFRDCIMSGVTTIRDVGGFPGKIIKFRKMADDNDIPGPRVISSLSPIAARNGDKLGAPEHAPYFTNPILKWIIGGNYAERPTSVPEIKVACEEMVNLGAQWLKTLHQDHPRSYSNRKLPNHSLEGYKTIVEIGRKHGIKCALHEPLVSGFAMGVELGFDTLEHMPTDSVIPDTYIDEFINKEMAIVPTMMIYGDAFIFDRILRLVESTSMKGLMPEAIDQVASAIKAEIAMAQANLNAEEYRKLKSDPRYVREMFPYAVANLKKLHRMGAVIGAGSDIGGIPTGFFGRFSDELSHYTAAGISNYDVLKMATSVNARILDMQDKIGTIEKGKIADIIAVVGNPLNDISAIDRTDVVMKEGLLVKYEGIGLS